MPSFSALSNERLDTCHEDLQRLFRDVVTVFDCKVIYGHRTPEEQFALYQKGRTEPGGIVTYKDGYEKLSMHNHYPSLAVDVVPYPVDWGDTDRMYYFGGWVRCRAIALGLKIRWGGDWDGDTEVHDQTFMDLAHFEVIQ